MAQIMSVMPKGANFKTMSPENKLMVEDYLRTGDQTTLMNIDFGIGSTKGKVTDSMLKEFTIDSLSMFEKTKDLKDLVRFGEDSGEVSNLVNTQRVKLEDGRTVDIGNRAGEQFIVGTGEKVTQEYTPVQRIQRVESVVPKATLQTEANEYLVKDPSWKSARETDVKIRRAEDLAPQVAAGNSKATGVFVRTVSEIYNADTRAASEIAELKSKGTIDQKIVDAIVSGTVGGLSDLSMEQYEAIMEVAKRSSLRTKVSAISQAFAVKSPGFKNTSDLASSLLQNIPSTLNFGAASKEHSEFQIIRNNKTGDVYQVVAGHYIKIN
jgi:hypothetical protein